MLRTEISRGAMGEVCDYCRKEDAKEMVFLYRTGKTWRDRNTIQVHYECLMKQIEKKRKDTSWPAVGSV